MISEIPDFVPGQRSISASALNAMKDAIARTSNITTNQGQTTYRAATGIHQILTLNPTFFWARITGAPLGYAYPFQEQQEVTPGVFSDLTGGRSGTTTDTPAYEQNHSTSVPVDSIVQIWTAESGDYIFSFSATGSDDPFVPITFVSDVTCSGGVLTVTKKTIEVEARLVAWTVFLTGNPTGGGFTLLFNGTPTEEIFWNTTGTVFESTLSTAQPGESVFVSGGPFPGTMDVWLSGSAILGLGTNSLTGGSNPAVNLTGP